MAFARLTADADLTVLPTTFQVVNEQFKKGLRTVHRDAINLTSRFAEQNFRDSIIREDHSVTLGGPYTYPRRTRASGRFTFGPGKTFTGSLLKNLGPNISGWGYPVTERAERLTDGAWRALEFGRPAFTMPRGFWFNEEGRVTRFRSFGGDAFGPHPRGIEREARGIEAKQFITIAFEDVVERFLEPEYLKLANKVTEAELRNL